MTPKPETDLNTSRFILLKLCLERYEHPQNYPLTRCNAVTVSDTHAFNYRACSSNLLIRMLTRNYHANINN